ncbi:hypothetical protein LTR86_000188 [Recurvomyces mirabilis]|nr:hypothetical protein LTR86_000188 [Recurvomyces mirabilis]
MDVAYDHVQEETYSPSEERSGTSTTEQSSSDANNSNQSLNADFQQAFQAVSTSPWGSRLGGWFTQARKQGETFVADLQKEAQDAGRDAQQGWTSLREQVVQRTRGLSLGAEERVVGAVPGEEAVPGAESKEVEGVDREQGDVKRPESLPADIVKEAGTLVASLRSTAAAKLKDLQKAEDAADEALLKFGTNVRNFLRDAVIITAPTDADSSKPKGTDGSGNEVLFETSEPGTGKKVFHTSRLDAQLHAIHTTASSFTDDPTGPQWESWQNDLDIGAKTEDIARDLEKYEVLRRAMEKLVPEKVEYRQFWLRYYFLRKAIEEDERKRKEILKGAASGPATEDLTWDDDDEDDDRATAEDTTTASTPKRDTAAGISSQHPNSSTTTLNAPSTQNGNDLLKPQEARRSTEDDKSVAGSDASYDIVSGATSRAAGSPREEKKREGEGESEEDDWE